MKFKIFMSILIVVIVAGFISAEADRKNDISLRNYAVDECRVDYTTNVIDDYIAGVPQAADMAGYVDILNDDLVKLKEFIDSNDYPGFSEYRRNTYATNQKEANQALRQSVKDFKEWNVSQAVRTELRESLATHRDSFNSCKFAANQEFAKSRAQSYYDKKAAFETKLNDMKAKNPDLNTDEMESIISEAGDFVDDVLGQIEAANDMDEIKSIVNNNCMFNGCKEGKNLHVIAKMNIARFRATLQLITDPAIDAGLSDQIDKVTVYLEDCDSIIEESGTGILSESQKEELRYNLSEAGKEMKNIINTLKGGDSNES
ncbi:hypothetical protein K9M79_03920 [Candidatus Woesearchaeota archaeon]|nr:hypothetical protein [Candidatus Woesearchaeota archaeon]